MFYKNYKHTSGSNFDSNCGAESIEQQQDCVFYSPRKDGGCEHICGALGRCNAKGEQRKGFVYAVCVTSGFLAVGLIVLLALTI